MLETQVLVPNNLSLSLSLSSCRANSAVCVAKPRAHQICTRKSRGKMKEKKNVLEKIGPRAGRGIQCASQNKNKNKKGPHAGRGTQCLSGSQAHLAAVPTPSQPKKKPPMSTKKNSALSYCANSMST